MQMTVYYHHNGLVVPERQNLVNRYTALVVAGGCLCSIDSRQTMLGYAQCAKGVATLPRPRRISNLDHFTQGKTMCQNTSS
jgi:hypothetical protein